MVSDSVHRLKYPVQSEGYHRRSGTESAHPPCGPDLPIHGEGQNDQPREQDCGAYELADVHGLPDPAAGVHSEYRGVVIGSATGMELGDHDLQHLSRKQQHGRHAQRR